MTNKIKPITYQEAIDISLKEIPDEVINAFNMLITKNLSKVFKIATVKQDDVIQKIIELMIFNYADIGAAQSVRDLRAKIFEEKWLDVEPLFSAAGWKVEYDKPGYSESYSAFYRFSMK